jgi:ABC-type branched-subunit amino acid transport system permease subunit
MMPKPLVLIPLLLALAFPFLPLGDRTAFIQQISLFVLSSAILALSWDFLARTGQLSLAHAAFFGLGAYTLPMRVYRKSLPSLPPVCSRALPVYFWAW